MLCKDLFLQQKKNYIYEINIYNRNKRKTKLEKLRRKNYNLQHFIIIFVHFIFNFILQDIFFYLFILFLKFSPSFLILIYIIVNIFYVLAIIVLFFISRKYLFFKTSFFFGQKLGKAKILKELLTYILLRKVLF